MHCRIRAMGMHSGLASISTCTREALWHPNLPRSLMVRILSCRTRHNSLAEHADWNPAEDSLTSNLLKRNIEDYGSVQYILKRDWAECRNGFSTFQEKQVLSSTPSLIQKYLHALMSNESHNKLGCVWLKDKVGRDSLFFGTSPSKLIVSIFLFGWLNLSWMGVGTVHVIVWLLV
jgi:hypothetical protein